MQNCIQRAYRVRCEYLEWSPRCLVHVFFFLGFVLKVIHVALAAAPADMNVIFIRASVEEVSTSVHGALPPLSRALRKARRAPRTLQHVAASSTGATRFTLGYIII